MGKFYEGIAGAVELWVRQFAWLNTAPDVETTGKGKKPEPVTRSDAMKAKGIDPVLPDNPAPYLSEWLFEIGPAGSGGMGGPLSWADMQSWSYQIGIELTPWEARTLRRLSRAFLAQRDDARKPDCEEPAAVEVSAEQQADKVTAQFQAMIGAFRKG